MCGQNLLNKNAATPKGKSEMMAQAIGLGEDDIVTSSIPDEFFSL